LANVATVSDETRSSAGREFQTTALETAKSLAHTLPAVRRSNQPCVLLEMMKHPGFPRLLENPVESWIFIYQISGTWKVLENEFGIGKSWKLN